MATYTYRVLAPSVLAALRVRDDAGAARHSFVDDEGGAPLRCCLSRSRPDESIMLVSYAPLRRWAAEHGVAAGPYDEVGPVFVHAQECPGPAEGFPDEVIRSRKVFRAYDGRGRILRGVTADPAAGYAEQTAAAALDELFADDATAVVHVRAVEFGCFLTEVRRPGSAPAASAPGG